MKLIKYISIIFLLGILITIFLLNIVVYDKTYKPYSFETLQDIKKYAAFYPEFPQRDNDDWIDPEYITYYKKIFRRSFINKVLTNLRIKKEPFWNIDKFKNVLEMVTKIRIGAGLKNDVNISQLVEKSDKFIIWGDLHSSFHSLVRDLSDLEKHKLIDNNLKITDNNIRFIFLGDTVGRSPYCLQVLNVILLIMEKNPDKTFYLRGNQENRNYWENFSLRRALKFMAKKNGGIPLVKEINLFFSTLPKNMYLIDKKNKKDKICCSHSSVSKKTLDDIGVKFIILGEKRFDILKEREGLSFLGYTRGAATWSLMSCPNEIYRTFFNFHFDSYLELEIGDSISTSVLISHQRDVRDTKNPEFSHKHFNPIFGFEIKKELITTKNQKIANIASTMSLTGVTGPLGREVKHGVETSFFFSNCEKAKKLIKPTIFDDGYVPRIALSNVKDILNRYSIDKLVIPTGTPTLSIYLDLVKQGKIAVLFPYTGAPKFRKKDIKNIINFRASYTNEVKAAIKYLIKTHGVKNFAFFYQNDSYGRPIAEAAQKILKDHGITKWLDLPHLKTQSDFKYLAKKIKEIGPSAIGCFSSHFPTQEFINQLGPQFFLGRILFGVSFLYSSAFQRFLENRGIDFILSSVIPDPFNSNIEIVQEHKKLMLKRGFIPNLNSLEGYIAASLFRDAIEKISPPFTKEKIINYFEGLKNYKYKGLTLTFNPEERDLSQPVWIRSLEKKWIEYKTK